MSSVSQTHSDFLNEFTSIPSHITSDFSHLEKAFFYEITSSEWTSWLDKQEGRKKLSKLVSFANKTHNQYIFSRMEYIKYCILELSKRDFSRLTDTFWASVSKHAKQTVQSVMTLPYPVCIPRQEEEEDEDKSYNKYYLEILDVCIPSSHKEISVVLRDTLHILQILGNKITRSGQILYFLDIVIEFIIYEMLINNRVAINSATEFDVRNIFFILIDPEYHGFIFKLDDFLDFMVDHSRQSLNTDFERDTEYIYLGILAKNCAAYLEAKKNIKYFPGLVQLRDENEFFRQIVKRIFIYPFKNYDATEMNNILESNTRFMDKLLECAEVFSVDDAIYMWKRINSETDIATLGIFKDSTTGGKLARLLYKVIGTPCLDIIQSDRYVHSLSVTDKEILAIWTHACSLFQHQPTIESFATEQESKEIPDIERRKWLRNRLHQIFLQSPKSKNDVIFYRGLPIKCGDVEKVSTEPMAVSFNKRVAADFAMPTTKSVGCLLDIFVPKNSHYLAIDRVSVYDGDENEILLMPNSKLIRLPKRKSHGDDDDDEEKDEYDKDEDEDQYYLDKEEALVKLVIDEEANKKIAPLPQPAFVPKQMTDEEFGFLLLKTGLVRSNWGDHATTTDYINMIDDILSYADHSSLESITDILFKSIRIWEILYCGFGDVHLAIEEFWRKASYIYSSSPNLNKLFALKDQCDIAMSSKTSILSDNKSSLVFDRLQDFVRPFVQEQESTSSVSGSRNSKSKEMKVSKKKPLSRG